MLVEAQISELQDASRVLMRYICTDSFFTGFTTAFHDFCFSLYWTNRLPFSTPTALPGIEPPVFRLVDIGHYDIEPSSVVRIQETKPFLILRLGFKLSSLMKLIVS